MKRFLSHTFIAVKCLRKPPTAVGFNLPDDCAEDSFNMLPILKQEKESVRTTHVHNTFKGKYAIRDGDWLLINHKDGYHSPRNNEWERRHEYDADDDSPTELYNLKIDIGQRNDMSGDKPEKVAELKMLLTKIREQGFSAPRFSTGR